MLRYLINNLIITNALRIYYITHCIAQMIEKSLVSDNCYPRINKQHKICCIIVLLLLTFI